MSCETNTHDPFERFPIRTSKGGGTKCTTCEIHLPCHDCCTCVPERVCISFDISCEVLEVEHSPLDTPGEAIWDCAELRYEITATCDGVEFVVWVYYEREDGICYAVLESAFLGAEGAYRPRVELTTDSHCRCPSYDFELQRSVGEFIYVRKWDSVAMGNIRCIDRGPDDCFGCRCMPRCLCGTITTAAEPLGVSFEACWYEDDYHQVACCCNGNLFPEVLIARLVSLNDQCHCAVPPYVQATDFTGQGHTINAPGPIVNLFHDIVSGEHVWEGTTLFCAATNSSITVTLRCTGTEWVGTVEITGASGTNTYEPTPEILSCNPFHMRLPSISDDTYCQTAEGNPASGSLFHVDIAEFRGWVGTLPSGQQISVYFEHVPVADPPQTNTSDCMLKIHMSGAEPHTLKASCDNFTTDLLCLSGFPISFLIDGEGDEYCDNEASTISFEAKGCRECDVEVIDPYVVTTPCCPNPTPRTLYLTGVADNDCPCADTVSLTLEYDDAEEEWSGTGLFCYCSLHVRLFCLELSSVWIMVVTIDGDVPPFLFNSGDMETVSFECDPFHWITGSVSHDGCCDTVMAASLFHFEVTE